MKWILFISIGLAFAGNHKQKSENKNSKEQDKEKDTHIKNSTDNYLNSTEESITLHNSSTTQLVNRFTY